MKYVSTRGQAEPAGFTQAVLAGLASDGGLYVPETWPTMGTGGGAESYTGLATRIISGFAGDTLEADIIEACVNRAYTGFAHHSVAPLRQIADRRFLMELHHGPTLAFKDVAMQLIAQVFDHLLAENGQRLSIVCATSGDTGGAAASAFAGLSSVDLFILHPHERVSPVQRRFMTTTGADNVHNFAIEGDFDDAQAIVKAMFADAVFAREVSLSGVNSINWLRIAAQLVYYAYAQQTFGAQTPLRFIVPTGNFGDVLAGYVAARCGLLAGFEAIAAVNANRTLPDLLASGILNRPDAKATPSPAMDIAVPSNLERLLFEVSGRDGAQIRRIYEQLAQSGEARLERQLAGPLSCTGISSVSVSDTQTLQEMRDVRAETGLLICPHTAVASYAARHADPVDAIDIVLATADAAKFPETVEAATGEAPQVPAHARGAATGEERFDIIPADLERVRTAIRTRRRR